MMDIKSKLLDEILNCPDVEWSKLGDIAKFYNGLTGKNKSDFDDGNVRYISYKNIFGNIEVDNSILDYVQVAPTEKQNEVKYGDVLFTASSETANEVGMSSAVTTRFDEKIYLNSFSFGIRFKYIDIIPEFSKYLFRSNFIRDQIIKTGNGVTRINVSKERFKEILIPIPPLPIQQKIVDILDKFTKLTAELTAELTARKQQYEYYRDELLTFGDDVEWKELGEIAEYSTERISFNELNEENYVGVDNLLQDKMGKRNSNHVPTAGNSTKFYKKDILIGNIRPYLKKIWFADCTGGTNGDVLVIHTTDIKIDPQYLYQVLADDKFFDYNMQHARGAKMPRGNKAEILKYPIPIPSLNEQARIVGILDKFDALTNSITEGLPREIELRQQQYEYYRDLLLSFPKPDGVK